MYDAVQDMHPKTLSVCSEIEPARARDQGKRAAGQAGAECTTFSPKRREMRFLRLCRRSQRGLYAAEARHNGLRVVEETRPSGRQTPKSRRFAPPNFRFWRKMLYFWREKMRLGENCCIFWKKIAFWRKKYHFGKKIVYFGWAGSSAVMKSQKH